jgi:hypothetical protein
MSMAVIVTADDWQTLYIDGEKKTESHSISLHDLETFLPNLRVQPVPSNVEAAMSYFGETCPDDLVDLARWGNDLVQQKEAADGRDD